MGAGSRRIEHVERWANSGRWRIRAVTICDGWGIVTGQTVFASVSISWASKLSSGFDHFGLYQADDYLNQSGSIFLASGSNRSDKLTAREGRRVSRRLLDQKISSKDTHMKGCGLLLSRFGKCNVKLRLQVVSNDE